MKCTLSFMYDAAMRAPDIRVPNGSVIHYEPAPAGGLSGNCWLCGCPTTQGVEKEVAIKPTFTYHTMARVPWSNVVCEHCHWALSYKSLRCYSILATKDGLFHPSRVEIRDVLLHPPEPPFALCIAESGQKWLHFRTPLCTTQHMRVRFEELDIAIKPESFAALLGPIEELYTVFSKEREIGPGAYNSTRIQEFGLERWEKLENAIMPYRRTGLFNLALFLAMRREEAETETKAKAETETNAEQLKGVSRRPARRAQRTESRPPVKRQKGEKKPCTTDSIPVMRTLL